ncbi:hypothetical protein AWB79_01592 [Caballeronia hypogeia]|uniref:Uncharacterized protein n=1 Tax=Caballeronia hypogeia TaxID=1777140 RepID=A0A157ZXZ8_9BURK|nr:hypothetical protein AWB79_01592 [Caballeronia hypogeia]
MMQLNRVAQWLNSLLTPSMEQPDEIASRSEFDPAWHGDHWQNLLSSPMDARHYVMEDWTTPLDVDLVAVEPAPAQADAPN